MLGLMVFMAVVTLITVVVVKINFSEAVVKKRTQEYLRKQRIFNDATKR